MDDPDDILRVFRQPRLAAECAFGTMMVRAAPQLLADFATLPEFATPSRVLGDSPSPGDPLQVVFRRVRAVALRGLWTGTLRAFAIPAMHSGREFPIPCEVWREPNLIALTRAWARFDATSGLLGFEDADPFGFGTPGAELAPVLDRLKLVARDDVYRMVHDEEAARRVIDAMALFEATGDDRSAVMSWHQETGESVSRGAVGGETLFRMTPPPDALRGRRWYWVEIDTASLLRFNASLDHLLALVDPEPGSPEPDPSEASDPRAQLICADYLETSAADRGRGFFSASVGRLVEAGRLLQRGNVTSGELAVPGGEFAPASTVRRSFDRWKLDQVRRAAGD